MNVWNGAMNCGISVSTFKGEVPFLLYLPFDFDSDTLEKSWEDTKKLYNEVVDEGWDIFVQYSGFRGFHCLVSVVPDIYSRGQIKAAQEFYKRTLNLRTCDTQIFGDVKRLIRIPGSLHAGKFKKIKGKGWQRMGEGGYCSTMKHTKGDLLDLDDYFVDEFPEYDFDRVKSNSNLHPYPCIDVAMNNREPSQLIRYSYVAYHLKEGKKPNEIINMLEEKHSDGKKYEWDDWNKEYTAKQIFHIAGRIDCYNPLKCSSLKSLGYCVDGCPYNYSDWVFKKYKDIKWKK